MPGGSVTSSSPTLCLQCQVLTAGRSGLGSPLFVIRLVLRKARRLVFIVDFPHILAYTVTVTNNGAGDAQAVTLTGDAAPLRCSPNPDYS